MTKKQKITKKAERTLQLTLLENPKLRHKSGSRDASFKLTWAIFFPRNLKVVHGIPQEPLQSWKLSSTNA